MSSLNQTFKAVKAASRELNLTDENTINRILLSVADEAEKCGRIYSAGKCTRPGSNG